MKTTDFAYELPENLIAHYPLEQRSASRLLTLDRSTGQIADQQFTNIVDYLNPGDVLVMNNSKVIPARIYGQKTTGGKIELLIERVIDAQSAWCHIKSSKPLKPGQSFILQDGTPCTMAQRHDTLFECVLPESHTWWQVMAQIGHMPLPPYMHREDEASDQERYQTVYADPQGSVAAPTAGLHFDEAMLEQLKAKSIKVGFVTLHVGAGTFQPVRVDDVTNHKMHQEWCTVDAALCDTILAAKARGNKVVAVGTTSVRTLESAALSGKLAPYQGETDIFIYPGFTFTVVDALITNFHLPESTLLMLVSAFSSKDHILKAYHHAIAEQYRFFSYGDAMLLY